MRLRNSTGICSKRLAEMFAEAVGDWPTGNIDVAVRHSRGSEFSGSCYYSPPRIYINLGRDNRYPYHIRTHIARASSNARCWWRELYTVELADASQLALFIFLHEFYHWLVRQARRNSRQKEARCDRFATRYLVDVHGCKVRDARGQVVSRDAWDFQDLEGFVAAAKRRPGAGVPIAVRPRPLKSAARPVAREDQFLLFS